MKPRLKTKWPGYVALMLWMVACQPSPKENVTVESEKREKTAFQTGQPWRPTIDVRADVAIVYGVGGNPSEEEPGRSFEERVKSWRERGYITHFMTGMAWGGYQDYFTGKWDGREHMDEGQLTREGDTIWHGPMVPYIVPTQNFIEYMKEKQIKRAIDAGIDAIYLEEPEFWAHGGYSEAFKREWKDYYGFDWRPQHASAENTYLSNKLKYYLYYRALNECFSYAKAYGKSKGMDVRCYVPTHSLINYSQWQIVSPEASLASLPCVDGYIAQVWTGTSRVPNYFDGEMKERVFENAFLEYGCMESMTAPTGRKVFFLTDPIEDRPRDWSDFKKNYEATFTAKLLYPANNNYEVMPWPCRIYEHLYQTRPGSDEKARIPRFYSTQMQVMVNSLNDMPISIHKVSGTTGVSVLMANSLMFQRTPQPMAGYDDPQLANFHGLALPFLKRGVPVQIMHLENVAYPKSWQDTKVLLMTYSNMKPLDKESHTHIAEWVKQGGMLVYCARDNDPFQQVPEWWNQEGNRYPTPSAHLFEQMGIDQQAPEGVYRYGKGKVCVLRKDPKEFVMKRGADRQLLSAVQQFYDEELKGEPLQFKNSFYLERGAYSLVSVMDESVNRDPYVVKGMLIDLFDPALPVLAEKVVQPGEQAFLYDVSRVSDPNRPQVLAAAARIYDESHTSNSYSFVAKSPIDTDNVMRVMLPQEPQVTATDAAGQSLQTLQWEWDEKSHTCLIRFENHPDGVKVALRW